MEPLTDVAYAWAIAQTLDRAEDEFDTGLSLDEREALADEITAQLTRTMSGEDTITEAGMARARAIKATHLARWALTIDEHGARRWLDMREPATHTVLPSRTILIDGA